jgi:hypothetical protein
VNILALDLGTKTGWALSCAGAITAGTWTLATPKEIKDAANNRLNRRCDPRFLRLLHELGCVTRALSIAGQKLDYCVFEDVLFGTSTGQCHLWATWRAAAWSLARDGVKLDCLNTASLKKFATGNGGATKEHMAKSLTMDPRYILHPKGVRDLRTGSILGDDAVDALHLLAWAQKTFQGGVDKPSDVGNVVL